MAVFRIEKTKDYTVMANHHLKNKELSLKAKGLLSVILSLPEKWNYTTRGLAAICKEGVDSIGSALKELELNGYIVRNRLRDNKGRITDTEYLIYETPNHPPPEDAPSTKKHHSGLPTNQSPHTALPHTESPYTENPYMDTPDTDNPAQLNTNESKTDQINYVNPSIYPSIKQPMPVAPPQDVVNDYRRKVRCNIEYYELVDSPGLSKEQLDEIVELMVETLCSTRLTIAVAGDELPATLVKDRLLKLNCLHIEYVMNSMRKNIGAVRNIKRYLLTALFNAPATIDHYYTAEFNYGYYGDGRRERQGG